MRDILSRGERSTLAAVAAARLLIVLDYDGTLAPLASRPGRARMRLSTRRLLGRLARVVPCAVISGRARPELQVALGDAPVVAVVGNYGAEGLTRVRPPRAVAEWGDQLAQALARVPGIWIEGKGFSLSVHYRASPRKAQARRAIVRAVARLRGAKMFRGRDVVNIAPRGAPDKGRALATLVGRRGWPTVVYVGDDETDEPAFARARAVRGLAIRVGRVRNSRATHFVRSQWHVDALLRSLIRLTRQPGAPRRRGR